MGKAIVWDPAEVTDADEKLFAEWDEEKEEAAIAEAAAAADVPCIIIEGRIFAGRFPDGMIIKAPLDMTVEDLDAVSAEFDNPVDHVKALLRRIGSEKSAEALERTNLASVVIFATKFFSTFERVAGAALGKLSS